QGHDQRKNDEQNHVFTPLERSIFPEVAPAKRVTIALSRPAIHRTSCISRDFVGLWWRTSQRGRSQRPSTRHTTDGDCQRRDSVRRRRGPTCSSACRSCSWS